MARLFKPTRAQKIFISDRGYYPAEWLVEDETIDAMMIVHRGHGARVTLYK